MVYLINRSLTKIIWNVIPEEAWSDHKSIVKQLHIFGSIYYIHIPKEKHNSNFSDRVHKCINFLGYEEQSKAYFLWDLENKKFVIKNFFFYEACTTEFEKYVDAQDIIVTNTLEILP